ncbi:MAG: hypothetical protein Q4A71_04260 [Actinomycetaceae bacterium]|nr:hypothetical protein [Actinomycetaceae bacterium]
MAKLKWVILGGLGSYLWARREIKKNPAGKVAQIFDAVSANPIVANVTGNAKDKVTEVVNAQGQKVTDKVAEEIKSRLFGSTTTSEPEPQYVDVEVEEVPASK